MTVLFAQPYDVQAKGFYFSTLDDYNAASAVARNDYGWPVEEFEIQFIDGETIDAELFAALAIHQGNVGDFLEVVDTWDDRQKLATIIAVGECGYKFDWASESPDTLDVEIHDFESSKDLAMHFVDEGLFGEIPKVIENYIDYNAIARDLEIDYGQVTVAGISYFYRM